MIITICFPAIEMRKLRLKYTLQFKLYSCLIRQSFSEYRCEFASSHLYKLGHFKLRLVFCSYNYHRYFRDNCRGTVLYIDITFAIDQTKILREKLWFRLFFLNLKKIPSKSVLVSFFEANLITYCIVNLSLTTKSILSRCSSVLNSLNDN